jgi:CRISPR-associated endonuclease/helicase Cas3
MAFALEHAIQHGKRRIIVVIPYTSVIEQTAKQYREVFGDEAVIEHHSNLDPDKETRRSQLASENWDAPIIVTTNVQFFESLFASRSSACRKLHNIVDSVIILDEAQMLPPGYLQPVVSVLRGLSSLFGASVVLCTATQPALVGRIESGQAKLRGFPEGSVRELMSDPADLSGTLRRVELKRHPKGDDPVSWEEIAGELRTIDRVLCIVNTRKDCRSLYELLPEGSVHLSALMCPEHRSQVVAKIKSVLRTEGPLRVVSTQLVEAGVDIDFPVVYRALAGLDSIAQAAGRCNREGKLNDTGQRGRVIVFRPPKDAPSGLLR